MCQHYWLLVVSGIQQGARGKTIKCFYRQPIDCSIECTFSKFAADIKLVVALGGRANNLKGSHSGGPPKTEKLADGNQPPYVQ